MRKKCPHCGKFMANGFPYDSEEYELDAELVRAWQLTEQQLEGAPYLEGDSARFCYVVEEWWCDGCNHSEPREGGKRWYWDGEQFIAPRPLTPAQVTAQENAAQEAAGQMRLIP